MNVVYHFMRARFGVHSFLRTLELQGICLKNNAILFLFASQRFGRLILEIMINNHLVWSESFLCCSEGDCETLDETILGVASGPGRCLSDQNRT